MSYMHINNLYKEQDILMFKECFAMEKIHGTSAHISALVINSDQAASGTTEKQVELTFFSGGAKHEAFVALFNQKELEAKVIASGVSEVTIYGEAYGGGGGQGQGMSATYGKEMKFIAFEVRINSIWLAVPQAEQFVKELGLEFVHYRKIPTNLIALDLERDAPSEQAFRNGCADRDKPETFKKREGVVLRPLIELKKNNGERVISKHKREDFIERKTQPEVTDASKLKVLADAQAIADEWVTPMRLTHVLDKFQDVQINNMPDVIKAMIEDVEREGKSEIVESKEARKAIGRKTVEIFKAFLKNRLKESQ